MNGYLVVAIVDDEVNEPEGFRTFNFLTEDIFEDLAIDTWEIFLDVALQDIFSRSDKMCEASDGFVSAVADAIGIGVGNEASLDEGSDDIAEGVMYYSVTIWGGGY